MTREEFVRAYADRSGVDPAHVTDFGLFGDNWLLVALPCHCGEQGCEGWAMLSAASILDHVRLGRSEPSR